MMVSFFLASLGDLGALAVPSLNDGHCLFLVASRRTRTWKKGPKT
jgi:hypothetical protein